MKFWEALKALEEGKTIRSVMEHSVTYRKDNLYTAKVYSSSFDTSDSFLKRKLSDLIKLHMESHEIDGDWEVVE